jgi:hypothetical protein
MSCKSNVLASESIDAFQGLQLNSNLAHGLRPTEHLAPEMQFGFKRDDGRRESWSMEDIHVSAMFVGQAAAELGQRLGRAVSPREVTGVFYDRLVPASLGPVVGGRRVICPEALDRIEEVLRERDAARTQNGGDGDNAA